MNLPSRPSLKSRILTRLANGSLTGREIAEAEGCSASYVYGIRRDLGLSRRQAHPRDRGALAAIDWEAVRTLTDFGWSQTRIARHFRVAQSTIWLGMQRRGIPAAFAPAAGRKRAGALSDAGSPGPGDHSSLVPLTPETISRAIPAQSSF